MHQRPPSIAIPTAATAHGVYGPPSRPSIFRSREEVSRLRHPSHYEDVYASERMPPMPSMPSYPTNLMPTPLVDDAYGDAERIEQRRTASPRRPPPLKRTAFERQSRTEEPEARPGVEEPVAGEAGKSVEDLNLRRRLTGQERLQQRKEMERQKRERRILSKEKTMHMLEDEINLHEQRTVEQREAIANLERQRDLLREQVADLEAEAEVASGGEDADERGGQHEVIGDSSKSATELEEERRIRLELVSGEAQVAAREEEQRRAEQRYREAQEAIRALRAETELLRQENLKIRAQAREEAEREIRLESELEAQGKLSSTSSTADEQAGAPANETGTQSGPDEPPRSPRPHTPIEQQAEQHHASPDHHLQPSPRFPPFSPGYSPASASPRRPSSPNFSPSSQRSSWSHPPQVHPQMASTRVHSVAGPELAPHSPLDQVSEAEDEDEEEEDDEEEDRVVIKREETSSVEEEPIRSRLLSTPFPDREYSMESAASSQPRKPWSVMVRASSDLHGGVDYGRHDYPRDRDRDRVSDNIMRPSESPPRRLPFRQDTIKTEATDETDYASGGYILPTEGPYPRRAQSPPVWSSEEEDNRRGFSGRRSGRHRSNSAPYAPQNQFNDSTVAVGRIRGYPREPTSNAFRAGTPPGIRNFGGTAYPPHEVGEWFLPRQEQVDRYIIQPMLTRALGSHQGSWILARKVAEAATAGKARVVVKQLMSRKSKFLTIPCREFKILDIHRLTDHD